MMESGRVGLVSSVLTSVFLGFIIVVVGGACRLVSLFSAHRKLELKLDDERQAVMFLFVCAPCSGSSWSDVSVPPLVKLGELFD